MNDYKNQIIGSKQQGVNIILKLNLGLCQTMNIAYLSETDA